MDRLIQCDCPPGIRSVQFYTHLPDFYRSGWAVKIDGLRLRDDGPNPAPVRRP